MQEELQQVAETQSGQGKVQELHISMPQSVSIVAGEGHDVTHWEVFKS